MRDKTQGDAGMMDRQAPTARVGERLADRIFALARQVAALHPPARHDPERFWRDKSELAAQLAEVGREAGRRELAPRCGSNDRLLDPAERSYLPRLANLG